MTAAEIVNGLELSPLQTRRLFRSLGITDGTETTNEINLGIWIFALITRLRFLDEEQKILFFSYLVDYLPQLAALLSPPGKEPIIAIADGRYATWTGYDHWLDLQTGEERSTPDSKPLESVAYHLSTLVLRNQKIMEERDHAKQRKETTDDARDIRNDDAGDCS